MWYGAFKCFHSTMLEPTAVEKVNLSRNCGFHINSIAILLLLILHHLIFPVETVLKNFLNTDKQLNLRFLQIRLEVKVYSITCHNFTRVLERLFPEGSERRPVWNGIITSYHMDLTFIHRFCNSLCSRVSKNLYTSHWNMQKINFNHIKPCTPQRWTSGPPLEADTAWTMQFEPRVSQITFNKVIWRFLFLISLCQRKKKWNFLRGRWIFNFSLPRKL